MLIPCEACDRFVRAHEAHCPFCNAARVPVSIPEPAPPRLSRAALVVASSLALGGCPVAVRYGGPPPELRPAAAPLPPAPAASPADAAAAPKR